MAEATARVVVGKITGVEPKGDWLHVSVTEEGREYPVRSSTKKEDIKKQAIELLAAGATVKAQIGEKESEKINPNNGKPYIDRYLNAIAVASPDDVSSKAAAQAQTGASPTQQSTGDANWQTKELHIMREHAMERSVEIATLRGDKDITPTGLVEIAEVLVAYYVYGGARFGVQPFDAGVDDQQGGGSEYNEAYASQGEQQSFDQPPAPTDDDIPFMPTIDGLGN